MKRSKILILILITFLFNSFGQKVEIFNTKDLLSISKSEGFISPFAKVDFVPIHYIDRATTQKLLEQTLNQPYSYEIERFLLDLSEFDDLSELIKPLNNLIRLKIDYIRKDSTSKYDMINVNLLNSLLIYNNKQTESLLIEYYKTWLKLAKKNRANYIKGKSDSLKQNEEQLNVTIANEIYDLMLPYKICNYNCYVIMLTLKKMGSNFIINKNLEFHKKLSESEDLSHEITIRDKQILFSDKNPKIITLTKSSKTIKDIDFHQEPMLKNSFPKKIKSESEIYGFYNLKSGFINICHDNSCYYYIIKLVGDRTLYIYETNMSTCVLD